MTSTPAAVSSAATGPTAAKNMVRIPFPTTPTAVSTAILAAPPLTYAKSLTTTTVIHSVTCLTYPVTYSHRLRAFAPGGGRLSHVIISYGRTFAMRHVSLSPVYLLYT